MPIGTYYALEFDFPLCHSNFSVGQLSRSFKSLPTSRATSRSRTIASSSISNRTLLSARPSQRSLRSSLCSRISFAHPSGATSCSTTPVPSISFSSLPRRLRGGVTLLMLDNLRTTISITSLLRGAWWTSSDSKSSPGADSAFRFSISLGVNKENFAMIRSYFLFFLFILKIHYQEVKSLCVATWTTLATWFSSGSREQPHMEYGISHSLPARHY